MSAVAYEKAKATGNGLLSPTYIFTPSPIYTFTHTHTFAHTHTHTHFDQHKSTQTMQFNPTHIPCSVRTVSLLP